MDRVAPEAPVRRMPSSQEDPVHRGGPHQVRRVDSKTLAEMLRLNSLPESYMPPPEIAELRERVHRRVFMVRRAR